MSDGAAIFTAHEARAELARRLARKNLLPYCLFTWLHPTPYIVGRHTRAICERLTLAIEDWRDGKSTYLMICVPFRHGKSELCSIALPTYFLGRCADRQPSIILSGYGAGLVVQFSRAAQRKMLSNQYQELFPGVVPQGNTADWGVAGSVGRVSVAGLGGALTGKGGDLLVLDDYCKSRAEAVSETYRESTWDAFRNDFFTRHHDPAIVIITATPWHIDDIRGRIVKQQQEDPSFPVFEEMNFPARKPGKDGWEYLFPERFSPEWYDSQRAVLQRQAAALLDCNPVTEGNGRFDTSKIVIHDSLEPFPKTREVRGWDLASSSKERDKSDPDWTWGVRGAVTSTNMGNGIFKQSVWITSMEAIRAEAPERDAFMRATILSDPPTCVHHVEAFAAYKDAYTTLRRVVRNRLIRPSRLTGDKAAKLAPLEAIFDAGEIHIYRPGCRQYLDMWIKQFSDFPAGAHDDACDATAVMFHAATTGSSGAVI